jgi:hypothetical protein
MPDYAGFKEHLKKWSIDLVRSSKTLTVLEREYSLVYASPALKRLITNNIKKTQDGGNFFLFYGCIL